MTTPDGGQAPLVRTGDRTIATLETPGLYLVEAGGSRGVVTVNVGGPEVSNLARTSLPASVTSAVGGSGGGRSWWVYGVLIAFVLVLAEW